MPTIDHDHLLDALTEGIERLTTSATWRAHLEVQSRFHRYSFSNTLLICAQDPGASRVAGFATWKKLGRSVMKGEHAIWILAPMTGRRTRTDEDEERRPIVGFRPVAVFDVGQTEGEALPQVCRTLSGHDSAAWFARLTACATALGYSVVSTELPGATNGDCAFRRRRIRVECRNDPAQQVKTLAHDPLTAPVMCFPSTTSDVLSGPVGQPEWRGDRQWTMGRMEAGSVMSEHW